MVEGRQTKHGAGAQRLIYTTKMNEDLGLGSSHDGKGVD